MLDDASIKQLHNILNESHELQSLDDFKTFIRNRIRHILPHETAMCVLGEIHSMRILRLINIDFPPDYLRRVIRPDRVTLSAPLKGWIHKRSPMCIDANDVYEKEDSAWHLAVRAFGIKSVVCHGIVDLSGAVFTYFEFSDIKTDAVPYKMILNLVIPHLHVTLVRLLTEEYVSSKIKNYDIEQSAVSPVDSPAQPPKPTFFDVTERERQILRWIAAGKSNWEIGKILLISEFTVKNHVQNVLKKMSATSRTQAATKAVSCGLIT